MYDNTVLLVDKPLTWTSFQVVKKLRNTLGVRKIGHAGTLDPLATGLLLLCTGNKTKKISQFQSLDKVYTGKMVIGKTTPSADRETAFEQVCAYEHITPKAVAEATAALVGEIWQAPPLYSAIKNKGKRAYTEARQGEKVKLPPRMVQVHAFTITKIALPVIHFKIKCGKGVYIRAMARDLGETLGVGAYLHTLRRTHIGIHCVDQASHFPQLVSPPSTTHLKHLTTTDLDFLMPEA